MSSNQVAGHVPAVLDSGSGIEILSPFRLHIFGTASGAYSGGTIGP
jgi:hypothetical protein